MENTDTELSNKAASFFSWIEFTGLVMAFTAWFFFRKLDWLFFLALFLIASGYIYKMYSDWKTGRKRAFKNGLTFLIVSIAAALLIGYIAGNRK